MNIVERVAIGGIWRRACRVDLFGVTIGLTTLSEIAPLKDKIQAALLLLQDFSPRHFEALRSVMPRILVFGSPSFSARYIPELDLCELGLHFLSLPETDARKVAMTLVHETVHAAANCRRLRDRGLSFLQEERLAVRSEVDFAQRLPVNDDLLREALWRLDNAEYVYSPARQTKAKIAALSRLGLPLIIVKSIALTRGIDTREIVDELRRESYPIIQGGKAPQTRDSYALEAGGYVVWATVCLGVSTLVKPAATLVGVAVVAGWTAIRLAARSRRRARRTSA